MKARNIEELLVWQRARELVNKVYALTKQQGFRKDFSLVDQIRRAVISVMSNIAEGYERGARMLSLFNSCILLKPPVEKSEPS